MFQEGYDVGWGVCVFELLYGVFEYGCCWSPTFSCVDQVVFEVRSEE